MLQPISTTVSRNHSKHMKTERLKHNGGSVPEAKDFSICALKIMDDCAQKKCLRGGLYFFLSSTYKCNFLGADNKQ